MTDQPDPWEIFRRLEEEHRPGTYTEIDTLMRPLTGYELYMLNRTAARPSLVGERGGYLLGIWCDGEAAARLWCRHHPARLGINRWWAPNMGAEYNRRRKARARRARRTH